MARWSGIAAVVAVAASVATLRSGRVRAEETTPSPSAAPEASAAPSPALTPLAHGAVSTEGFGNVKWGMSRAQVLRAYPKARKVGDKVAFQESVAGHSTLVVLFFAGDRLSVVGVSFQDEHANDNLFLQDYDEISSILTKKYGEPTSSGDQWSNELFKDEPSQWGVALAAGHLVRLAEWQTAKTSIEHVLKGDNFKVDHHIRYGSRELEAAQEQQSQADAASEL